MTSDPAVDLDLTGLPFHEQAAPVLRAASRVGAGESVRVRVRTISWPVMAALNMDGLTYRILDSGPGEAEFVIQRALTDAQRRCYLRDRLRPRYPGEYRLDRDAGGRGAGRKGNPPEEAEHPLDEGSRQSAG